MAYPEMFFSIFVAFWSGVIIIAVGARALTLRKLSQRTRRRVQQRQAVTHTAVASPCFVFQALPKPGRLQGRMNYKHL